MYPLVWHPPFFLSGKFARPYDANLLNGFQNRININRPHWKDLFMYELRRETNLHLTYKILLLHKILPDFVLVLSGPRT